MFFRQTVSKSVQKVEAYKFYFVFNVENSVRLLEAINVFKYYVLPIHIFVVVSFHKLSKGKKAERAGCDCQVR